MNESSCVVDAVVTFVTNSIENAFGYGVGTGNGIVTITRSPNCCPFVKIGLWWLVCFVRALVTITVQAAVSQPATNCVMLPSGEWFTYSVASMAGARNHSFGDFIAILYAKLIATNLAR